LRRSTSTQIFVTLGHVKLADASSSFNGWKIADAKLKRMDSKINTLVDALEIPILAPQTL
jgi:hypothetical protein